MPYKNTQRGSVGIIVAIVAITLIGGWILYSGKTTPKSEEKMAGHEMMSGEKMGNDMMMGKGVILKDGKIMLEEDGKMSPLVAPYAFETGITVALDGTVTKKDGTTFRLKEGQSVWKDGSLMMADEHMMMGDKKMNNKDMMGDEHPAMMGKAGTYEAYAPEKIAKAATGKVVLFFHASWCPTCRALDGDIKAHLGTIPENVTILDIDYDKSDALKQKYKVTTQHTLVQVDAKGNEIKQWKGSLTLVALVGESK